MGESANLFAAFWSCYPRKVAKADAQKAWRKLNPSAELVAHLLGQLDWQIEAHLGRAKRNEWTPDWPYPATWLRGRRWEDQPDAKRPGMTTRAYGAWREECQALHGGSCENAILHDARKAT